MEDKLNFIQPLIESAEKYGNTSYELLKLKALDTTVEISSTIVSRGTVVLLFHIFLIFLNFGLSIWLGEILGKLYYGFFCVAVLYGILGGVLYFFFHKWFKNQIGNSILSQISK